MVRLRIRVNIRIRVRVRVRVGYHPKREYFINNLTNELPFIFFKDF